MHIIAKAMAGMYICADSFEHLLLENAKPMPKYNVLATNHFKMSSTDSN